MSDQENPDGDGSPIPKRSRLSRPLQALSQPVGNANIRQNTCRQRSQPLPADHNVSTVQSNSIAGVIKKLQLTNFMCHGNFEIEFNPRINFISGANGSGKSALQTAIAIGLGGQASKTNRSSKIEGLIKHGCHSASVTVTLTNIGANAFKPIEYGNEIKIIRSITSSSSNYRIYNQWGKLMSNKKAELDLITLKFKIQPNNPVSILNQDMARNFLSSNRAENKYAMFKKATLLDEAEAMLNNINVQIAEQRERIIEKEKTEEILSKEIDVMAEKMKWCEELTEARKRKSVLMDELMWAEAHKHREELKRLEDIYEEHEKQKVELQEKGNEIKNEISEKEKEIEKLEQNLVMLQNESRTKEETVQRYRQEFRVKKDKFNDKRDEFQRITNTIRNKKLDKDQIKASLDDIEKEENEQKMKKEEAKEEISRLQNILQENNSKVEVLEQEISRHAKTLRDVQDMMRERDRRINKLREEIREHEKQMNSLETSDNLSIYGPWMPKLVKQIEEAVKRGKFSKPPKGPLGRFVQVKNEKWTNAIESYLGGGLLSSFFVNNANDRNELYKIMNQVINGRKPTVHCSLFQEKERGSRLAQIEVKLGSHLSILRALNISDPVVANFLMDMKQIHQVLMIEDRDICRKTMTDRNWVRNCVTIIDREANSYNEGCRYYANMKPQRARLLQKSVADHIGSLKEEVEEKNQAIIKERSELKSLQEKFNAEKSTHERRSIETREYRTKISRTQREITELKNIINFEAPSLQTKFEELTSLETEIVELEEQKKKTHEEQKRLEEEMMQAKKFLDKCGIGDTALQQSHLSQEMETVKKNIDVLKRRVDNLGKKIEEQNVKLDATRKRLEEKRTTVQDKESTASQLSQTEEPAPENMRTVAEVQKDIDEGDAFIAEAERIVGAESITFATEFINKQKSRLRFRRMFSELKKMHDKYKNMSSDRKDTIRQLRDVSASVVYTQFEKVIHSRNYKGQLVFDHARGRLEIQLAPPDSGNSFMNSESLSGGEKSVSTVAFLMALWSNMDLPFYSMDEYDVFMDAINRRTITGLLTSFATDKSSRQFIFLTPLDVSLIQTGPDVTVHRVKKIK